MKKIFLFLILALAIGLISWQVVLRIAANQAIKTKNKGPRPVAVVLEPVSVQTISHVASFTGTLEAGASYVVAPKITGRVEKLSVDIGDTVRNGQIIALLDSHEYEQAVIEAEAALEVARASLIEARSDLAVATRDSNRQQSLRTRNAVSQSDLDDALAKKDSAQARLLLAQAQVRQQEAALEAAKVRLNYTRIRALWEGPETERVVGERFTDEGDTIDAKASIVSVVALDPLRAVINVIERDFPYIKQGQIAEISTDAYPGRIFEGQVSRLAPILQESSRQGRVEISVPNKDRLLVPGMFARVRLNLGKHPEAITVPLSAIARREGKQGVFLAVDKQSKARFIPVALGFEQDHRVEVLPEEQGQSLSDLVGGQVVTLGKHLLEDGGAIRVPDANKKKSKD